MLVPFATAKHPENIERESGVSTGAQNARPIQLPWMRLFEQLLEKMGETEMVELTRETQEFFEDMLDLQEEMADTLQEIRDLLVELVGQDQQKKTSHVRRIREKK